MEFHVYVGILPHERELAQPLHVDLTVRHDASAALDYRDLYAIASDVVARDERTYLEPIAEAIASRALALAHVSWCRVAIRKPHVALGGALAYAQVAVERSRA